MKPARGTSFTNNCLAQPIYIYKHVCTQLDHFGLHLKEKKLLRAYCAAVGIMGIML